MSESHQLVRTTLDQLFSGLIASHELHDILDREQIRGSLYSDHYTGYDYRNQQWITIRCNPWT